MKINGLHIDGFGVWRDLTVEGIPGGMTVFFGRNEAGKSTLMQFIRSVFFGFTKERRDKYLPPVYGGSPGGSLFLDRIEGAVQIQRHADLQRPQYEFGDVVITTPEGTASGQNRLQMMMNEIDEAIFSHVFAIGLQEIQELGALNDTQAADHLYRLTSGFDRVSLIDVLRNIRQTRETLIRQGDDQSKSQLDHLLHRRKELLHEVDQLVAGGRRWSKVAAHAKDFSRQLSETESRLEVHELEARRAEMGIQIAERWQNRKLVQQQIAAFGSLPELVLVDVKRLESLNQSLEKQKHVINDLNVQRRTLKESVDNIPVNRVLWRSRTRIEALGEHIPWLDSIEREVTQIKAERKQVDKDLEEATAEITRSLRMKPREVNNLTPTAISSLRSVARGIKEDRDRLTRAEDDVREAEIEAKHLADTLEAARAHAGVRRGAPSTLEDTSRLATRIRKRTELDEKIESLEKTRRDLQRDMDDVVEDQELPIQRLIPIFLLAIGGLILFYFGSTRILSGGTDKAVQGMGLVMAIMGFVFTIFAWGLKQRYDRNARDELNDFLHQIDLTRQQIKRARQTRDELDAELPPGVTHWETRLKEAEGQIGKMEDIIPLENKLRASQQHLETLRLKRDKTDATLKKGQRHWRDTLKSLGLPEQLKPSAIKDIARHIGLIEEFQRNLDEMIQRLADKENEHKVLCSRIHTLAEDTHLSTAHTDPRQRLDAMKKMLIDQRDLIQRREELAAKFKRLRQTYNKERVQMEKITGGKRRLLTAAGASSEEQFRDFALQHQQRQKLEEKLVAIDEQIRAALGGHFAWEEVIALVEKHGSAGLERVWEKLSQEIEALKQTKANLHLERGKLLQEMNTLSSNDRLEMVRLELSSLDSQIQDLKEHWQQLACTNQMLESVREQHEKLRQPETLREASKYLEKLTDGQYTRIWTKLVGEHLIADNEKGQSINVELLSRGTREAVFLSLRLALVSAYARRGVILPMVLDDVLVNFDAERAESAARVLAEFAGGGYQVLMFTCHEHIHKVFSANGCSVQVLPHHRDVVKTEGEGTVIRVDADDDWDYLIDAPGEEIELADDASAEVLVESVAQTAPQIAVAPTRALVTPVVPNFDMWWEGDEDPRLG